MRSKGLLSWLVAMELAILCYIVILWNNGGLTNEASYIGLVILILVIAAGELCLLLYLGWSGK